MKTLNAALYAAALLCLCMIMTGCFNRQKPPGKLYFEPPSRLIEDYAGMVEVMELNWAWTQPGFRLGNYQNVTLAPIINHTEVEDDTVARQVAEAMASWFIRNGFSLSENGDIICEGAIVAVKLERSFFEKRYFIRERDADLFLEMEFILSEMPAKNTLCKIRHGVVATQRDQLVSQLLSGLLSYFDSHR